MKKTFAVTLAVLSMCCLSGCALIDAGGNGQSTGGALKIEYDHATRTLKWNGSNAYYYQVMINDKTYGNQGCIWLQDEKYVRLEEAVRGLSEIYIAAQDINNTFKVRTYNENTRQFGKWYEAAYTIDPNKLSVPLVDAFISSITEHRSDTGPYSLEKINSIHLLKGETEDYLLFAATYHDNYNSSMSHDERCLFDLHLEGKYTSLLEIIQDHFVNGKSMFPYIENKGNTEYKKSDYDFTSRLFTWDDLYNKTLNQYKDSGYAFEVINAQPYYGIVYPTSYGSAFAGFDGIIKATNGDKVDYLAAFFDYWVYKVRDGEENGYFTQNSLDRGYEDGYGIFRLEGDFVDFAMMLEYEDPTGESTPFYEKTYTTDETAHWRKNNHDTLTTKKLNYEEHTWKEWYLKDGNEERKYHNCEICGYVGIKEFDCTEILEYRQYSEGKVICSFTSNKDAFLNYPYSYIVIPDVFEGQEVIKFEKGSGDYLSLIAPRIKSIVFGDNITTVNLSFKIFENLEYIHLPTYMASNDFPTEIPNIEYNEYENGLYLGNEDNPYLIFCRSKDENPETIIVHKDTRMMNKKAFFFESLKSISVPFLTTSIPSINNISVTEEFYTTLYNYGEFIEYFRVYDNTTSKGIEIDRHFSNLKTLILGEGIEYAKILIQGRGADLDSPNVYLPSTLKSFKDYCSEKFSSVISYNGTKDKWFEITNISNVMYFATTYHPNVYVLTNDGYKITYSYNTNNSSYYYYVTLV